MDSLPFAAQRCQTGDQGVFDATDLPEPEPIVFSQFHRSIRTVQVEYGLAALANDMDMGRPMIVRVDHGALCANAQNRRHRKD
jgi:hypothetical protein